MSKRYDQADDALYLIGAAKAKTPPLSETVENVCREPCIANPNHSYPPEVIALVPKFDAIEFDDCFESVCKAYRLGQLNAAPQSNMIPVSPEDASLMLSALRTLNSHNANLRDLYDHLTQALVNDQLTKYCKNGL